MWLHFFMDTAKALGGQTDPRLKEFIARFNFCHLGGPAQLQVAPDVGFIRGCCALVGSKCLSSQVEGLKGLKLALSTCESGDALSKAVVEPVQKALHSAADSKNPTVLRLASATLVVAAQLFCEVELMLGVIRGSLARIMNAITPKLQLLGGRRPDLETRQTLQNVEEALSMCQSRTRCPCENVEISHAND
uniref:Uncharacterized protein n=3 Tax=Lotharella globosa TaxID=91324 RepID=A0A6V3ICU5_9EUKA|mmetsp:Transcript_11742/g.22509  ORF Transcript_11742/g.22509 Transcript_11742/m.22509 type:complete len:191 (+) Transcript_11742:980-1552(+)